MCVGLLKAEAYLFIDKLFTCCTKPIYMIAYVKKKT